MGRNPASGADSVCIGKGAACSEGAAAQATALSEPGTTSCARRGALLEGTTPSRNAGRFMVGGAS
jgi:hypothetical protein